MGISGVVASAQKGSRRSPSTRGTGTGVISTAGAVGIPWIRVGVATGAGAVLIWTSVFTFLGAGGSGIFLGASIFSPALAGTVVTAPLQPPSQQSLRLKRSRSLVKRPWLEPPHESLQVGAWQVSRQAGCQFQNLGLQQSFR